MAFSLGDTFLSGDDWYGRRATASGLPHDGLVLQPLRRERALADEFPMRPLFRALLADVTVQGGDQPHARRTLADAAADNFGAFPPDNQWLVSLSVLGDVAAHVDAGEHAEALYGLLEPHAARHALNFAEVSTGAVARTLGLLSAAMGYRDNAERHFQQALELNASVTALPWLAHTEYDYAVMLLRWGRASDRRSAASCSLMPRGPTRRRACTSGRAARRPSLAWTR